MDNLRRIEFFWSNILTICLLHILALLVIVLPIAAGVWYILLRWLA